MALALKRPAAKLHPAGRVARAVWIALLAAAALAPSGALASEHFAPFHAPADPQAPRISALHVEKVARVRPGTRLRFELQGTPGAQASLRIDGARRGLGLAEVSPGHYEGVYTVGMEDRISPDATVVGNLRRGERLGLALLTGPLQRDDARVRLPA